MIGAIVLILVLYGITTSLLSSFKTKFKWFDVGLMQKLYWYHVFFAIVYYIMGMLSRSDSHMYYLRPQIDYADWFSSYTTGTRFLDFLNYPLINYLNFSYEMMMMLYAWLGYVGFIYFYIFFKENTRFKHKLFGYDLLTILIFLPNMHYWTASLGKGSLIFWGIAMTTYGISQIKNRKLIFALGLTLVYHIRPHVFMFMVIGIIVGLFTGRQKVPFFQKFLVFAGSAVALIVMYDKIIDFAGLNSDNLLESFDKFSSTRAFELAKSNSGIDTSKYPLVLKLFTFWYRPLFVDAPNAIGLIVSTENVLYLYLTFKLFQGGFFSFLKKSPALVKMSLVVFLATSLALGETLSNMGIIIRQKSQVMYFFLFVILSYLDYKKGLMVSRKKKILPNKLTPTSTNDESMENKLTNDLSDERNIYNIT